jgi:hypothetical protein
MNTKRVYFVVLTSLLLSSCGPSVYYQVYKAVPADPISIVQNALIYEDDNCEIAYNLWADGGNVGFSFYNKTDENINLKMDESFFILNGVAHDYYKNRVFKSVYTTGSTVSHGASASTSVTGFNFLNLLLTNRGQASKRLDLLDSSESSVSYDEQEEICIPPHTMKHITEYKISDVLYRDCDLYIYPKKRQLLTKRFHMDDSPIIFSNRLVYELEKSEKTIKFENEFYISEISNYPEKEITTNEYSEFCGQTSQEKRRYFKDVSPEKFYIRYEKGIDQWEH